MGFLKKISTYLNTFQFNRIFNTNSNYCWKVVTYVFHNHISIIRRACEKRDAYDMTLPLDQ